MYVVSIVKVVHVDVPMYVVGQVVHDACRSVVLACGVKTFIYVIVVTIGIVNVVFVMVVVCTRRRLRKTKARCVQNDGCGRRRPDAYKTRAAKEEGPMRTRRRLSLLQGCLFLLVLSFVVLYLAVGLLGDVVVHGATR